MLNFSEVLAIDETTKKLVAGGIENETRVLFERVKKLVESNNSSMDKGTVNMHSHVKLFRKGLAREGVRGTSLLRFPKYSK